MWEGHGVVHFGVDMESGVRPLCGDWMGAPSWTKLQSAVSCPRCLALLVRATRTRWRRAA